LYYRSRRKWDVARARKPKANTGQPEAISLEDEEPLAYIGEEAYAPIDTGTGPAEEDLNPPDIGEEEEPPLEVPLS
jgi:hypothetical protein